jgi:type II secretory pathway pseudopilin PulG
MDQKMKKNQKGFSHVEILLLVVIVGIIGFVGWYVLRSVNQADKNLNSANGPKSIAASKKNVLKQGASSPISSNTKATAPTPVSPVPAAIVSPAPAYVTTTPAVVNNYVTIPEWSVKFKHNGTITIMYAHDSKDKNNRAVFFGSSQLAAKNNACKAEFYPAGYIVRYKGDEHYLDEKGADSGKTTTDYTAGLSNKDSFKKIGDYYYFYRGPVAKCSELKEIQDLQDQSAQAVKAFFDSLEAV